MNPNHLKDFWRGLATFMLMMSSSLGTAFPDAAASNLPRVRPAASFATFSQLDLYANIETVGVVVSGTNLPVNADLMVRQSNDTAWHSGHPLMRIKDGRLVGSLFGLTPATTYDIKVLDGATEISGSITTQPEELQFTPSAIVHVYVNAPAGGDGSAGAPFRTIQEGVNHAGPGTQVLVADGVYHETVLFPSSGSTGNWIQVKAQGSGAILDGSENRTGNIWTPVAGKNNVYFTKINAAISYLARDQKRFYAYDDLSGLNKGLGHNEVPMNEGWYFEASTLKLYVRNLDDPSSHSWQIPTLNHAFDAAGHDWLWIEGFEVRFYGTATSGCGVCTINASHVVIRKNKIHNLQLGIFINWNGGDNQGNDTRIENNEIYDPPVNEWAWNAVKGSSMEGTAIVVRGRTGAIVRGNELHNFFNGIYTGSSGALDNSALAFDADIYNNHIHLISDDALEPEGACINQRFRNNIIDSVFVGFSSAPITQGPTWVLRTSFTNFSGRGFKWDGNSDGIVLIYHNTSWSNAKDINAMDMISPVHNAVLRNNIFQSNGYGVYEVATGSTGHDWNHDDWYVTRASLRFKWENVFYNTLATLCTGTGLECNGHEYPPGLVNPGGGDFTLLSSSSNIDQGVVIPGINDDFFGSAPDIGAFEYAYGFTISGNAGVPGATLSYLQGTPKSATADGTGFYSFMVPGNWSGTVTPSKAGYAFNPASIQYTNITSNQPNQNYTAEFLGAPAATLIAPSGNIGTNYNPTYTWNQVSNSTWYYLWVDGPSGNVIQQWYTSAQAACNGTTCSVTPATTLTGGEFTWKILTYNFVGDGAWSSTMSFNVTPPPVPGAATLVAPNGNIGTNHNPTYTWNEVPDSTWYYLWVDGPSGNVIKQWYTSAQTACNGTTCSITPAITLEGGTYTWKVMTYNSSGDGPWSASMNFTSAPGAATLVAPTGSIGTNYNPTYTWNQVSSSTWYLLQVNGPNGTVVYQWYTLAQSNCNGTTCSVTPTTTLVGGAYTWWILTYNSAGDGLWSTEMNFNTTLPGKLGPATLVSPTGSIGADHTPTYTWSQVGGSTWYLLQVKGPSGTVVYQWYTLAQSNCNGTTCSVTPSANLTGGAYTWWVLTYSTIDGTWSTGMNFSVSP